MLKKNEYLVRPHGNTVIWRYLSLDKFLDLLVTSEIFFSNAGRMTDKYEGTVPKRNRKYFVKHLTNQTEFFTPEEAEIEAGFKVESIDSFKNLTLLNCWTISQHESYALWKIYLGGAKAGVAIKTTVSKLEKAIRMGNDPVDDDIYLSKVNYTDYIKEGHDNRFKIITTKNDFYNYENELRLFILHFPKSEGGTVPPYDIRVGRRLKVDLNELIDSIYLSPFSGRWLDDTLIKTINAVKPDLTAKIENSEIYDE